MSPPTSPIRPAPPVSALPSVPQTNNQVQADVEPSPPSPTEPSAPPASPSLLAFLSPSLVKNNPSQSHPEALPASPPNTPTQPERPTFCFESGLALQAPTAPLPERPQSYTGRVEQDTNNRMGIRLYKVIICFSSVTMQCKEEHITLLITYLFAKDMNRLTLNIGC